MSENYCTTCENYDTRRCNGDVAWCRECGDTEGIVWSDDYEKQQWEKLIKGK